jgi:hypothetical protein
MIVKVAVKRRRVSVEPRVMLEVRGRRGEAGFSHLQNYTPLA